MSEKPFIDADDVRAIRKKLALSAEAAARLVGINDGSGWRRWERDGASGPAALLIGAMAEMPALRKYLERKQS